MYSLLIIKMVITFVTENKLASTRAFSTANNFQHLELQTFYLPFLP